ncbi:MAG: prephenate dehydrogenase, partial [Salana multivorans]|nr:prephenate dehydrogenase [Salana multivorans]
MSEPPASRPVEHAVSTAGPVHVVGSGLLGASIGLGLARAGVEVTLEDASPAAAALARDVGA